MEHPEQNNALMADGSSLLDRRPGWCRTIFFRLTPTGARVRASLAADNGDYVAAVPGMMLFSLIECSARFVR
jgi:hypothetical protein